MIYIVSLVVFLGIILFLVAVLILVELALTKKGDRRITINKDGDKALTVSGTPTLLSVLVGNNVLLPSACGGGGSCGMCKCVVNTGGGDILPTELVHLSRKEKNENVRVSCQVKVKDDMEITIPDEIFNIRKYTGTVKSNANVATFIKELIIELDEGQEMICEAGSYIQIDIPEYKLNFTEFDVEEMYRDEWDTFDFWQYNSASDEEVSRAYSLANPPSEKKLMRLTVRIATPPPHRPDAPPGVASSYIFNLKPGDPVTISGPYGDFFVKDTQREMCFVGGGAGMAPMRTHIFHQFHTLGTQRKATFWYGARSKREVFYEDEFVQIQENHPNFTFHLALSSPMPEDDWDGMEGFIHDVLDKNYLAAHEDPTEIEYYLCGPPMMIDAVIDMLDSYGVEEEMIHYDKF